MNESVIQTDKFASIRTKAEAVIDRLVSKLVEGYSPISAFSGGKDSTCTLVLMLEAYLRARDLGIKLPRGYISHGETRVENPAISFYTYEMIASLEAFIDREGLPLEVVVATPSLASTFAYSTIGRGKLPIHVNSSSRDCSVDWKIRPQTKAMKQILKGEDIGKSITLVGTRFEESTGRKARMEERGDGPEVFTENEHGSLVNTPIADWDLTDAYSGPFRSLIPVYSDHPFWKRSIIDSGFIRSLFLDFQNR